MRQIKCSLLFITIFLAVNTKLISADETLGTIGSINKLTGEVLVNLPESGNKVKIGDLLYVRVNGKAVIMKSVFPMMTVTKCRLEKDYTGQINNLSKGATVYRYSKSTFLVEEKKEPENTGTTGVLPQKADFRNVTWELGPPAYMTWEESKNNCIQKGMRLPTIEEWDSAYKEMERKTWEKVFSGAAKECLDRPCYWALTENDDAAYYFYMESGNQYMYKTYKALSRCVKNR